MKTPPTEWENVFANNVSDMVNIQKVQRTQKKLKQTIWLNEQRTWKHASKEDIYWPTDTWKNAQYY